MAIDFSNDNFYPAEVNGFQVVVSRDKLDVTTQQFGSLAVAMRSTKQVSRYDTLSMVDNPKLYYK